MPEEMQYGNDFDKSFEPEMIGSIVQVDLYKKVKGVWKLHATSFGRLTSFTFLIEDFVMVTSYRFDGFAESVVLSDADYGHKVTTWS